MRKQKWIGWWTLAVGLVLCATTAPAWAVDTDGDGVDDPIDVCINTPPGTAVDEEGRPLGDIDLDCDHDLEDFTLGQHGFTGPLPPPVGACCYYPGGVCVVETEAECTGDWQGAGTGCDPNPCAAPPGMVFVAAGEFQMGDTYGEGLSRELPVHAVYLDAYFIDIHEVTNEQYVDALNWALGQGGLIHVSDGVVYQAGGTYYPYSDTYSFDHESRIHWNGETFTVAAGKENHPALEVCWWGSVAYCNWRSVREGRTPSYDLDTWACDFEADGYRLPTEAEWEKAAAWDPIEQRHYRFGEHSDGCGPFCLEGERANYWESGDPYEVGDDPWSEEQDPRTTPVGFYTGELHYKVDFDWPGSATSYQTEDARSYYGCRDMSGNVWEWCNDWYDPEYYGYSPYDNPTGPAVSPVGRRVIRGGPWLYCAEFYRSSARYRYYPNDRNSRTGFRCVVGTQ